MSKRKIIVGELSGIPGLVYSPVNEQGVVFLFSKYHKELGIQSIECIRDSFPDAIGLRKIGKEANERVNIEFEYKSSGFKKHLKELNPDEQYIVICWEDNWENPPKGLEIIELKTKIPKLIETGKVSKTVRQLTKTQREYLTFFEDVLGRFKAKLPAVTTQKALPQQWCSIPIGITNIHLEWCILGRFPNRSISVELHFERSNEDANKKLFEYTKAEQNILEKELGDLHFQYPWCKNWARIYQIRSYNATDNEEVEKAKLWAVETMINFHKVFKQKVEKWKTLI
jgi:hypothetical protein